MAGYVNTVRAIYCLLRTPGPRGKQFLRFLKTDLLWFQPIYLLIDWIKLLFFDMCLLRINLPNMCPNMNHFDAVDFSECHSEEVISFFWRSVYSHKVTLASPRTRTHTLFLCYFWSDCRWNKSLVDLGELASIMRKGRHFLITNAISFHWLHAPQKMSQIWMNTLLSWIHAVQTPWGF